MTPKRGTPWWICVDKYEGHTLFQVNGGCPFSMLTNSNILSGSQAIQRDQLYVDGTTALKLNTPIPRPADQEVFAATPWKTGNTGLTKK